jgi:ion channel-forming bestrophin family protein
MYIGKDFTFKVLWHYATKNLIRTAIVAAAACVLYKIVGWQWVGISFVPVASVGTAVAFYVGFKNNQAYDRLWEARKLWGQITNTGRAFTAAFISIVPDKKIQREFVYRHFAWINILRLQLRRTIPWATSKQDLHRSFISEEHELLAFEEGLKKIFEERGLMEYYEMANSRINTANHTIKKQIHELGQLKKQGVIDDYEHSDFVRHMNTLLDCQGGCERIKSTPLFRQYSIFSRVFVVIFIFLLPFGMLKEMDKIADWGVWLTIPFSMLISWIFYTMEQIGEFSENPFDNGVNDIPLNSICRNIEIELMEFVGDTDLPEKIVPIDNVLM